MVADNRGWRITKRGAESRNIESGEFVPIAFKQIARVVDNQIGVKIEI